MAEYTVEDYRKAAKAAYEAGDIEAAEALIEEGMALEQRLKPAPTGAEIVEQFDDGGRILKSTQTGQETYVTDGYTTSDPARIAQIRAAGGKAGEVYKTSMAEDIISQVGELPARAASAIKGVPFVGSYIDEIIGQFSPEAAQATRAAQEARESNCYSCGHSCSCNIRYSAWHFFIKPCSRRNWPWCRRWGFGGRNIRVRRRGYTSRA